MPLGLPEITPRGACHLIRSALQVLGLIPVPVEQHEPSAELPVAVEMQSQEVPTPPLVVEEEGEVRVPPPPHLTLPLVESSEKKEPKKTGVGGISRTIMSWLSRACGAACSVISWIFSSKFTVRLLQGLSIALLAEQYIIRGEIYLLVAHLFPKRPSNVVPDYTPRHYDTSDDSDIDSGYPDWFKCDVATLD